MKNLLITLLPFFILLVSCQESIEEPMFNEVTFDVGLDISFISRSSGGRSAIVVDGYEHKFDTVTLIASNTDTYKWYQKQEIGTVAKSILIPDGTYDFIMSAETTDIFSNYLAFESIALGVEIEEGADVILNTSTKQALLLVNKENLEGPPIIEVLGADEEDYAPTTMWEDEVYYYMYVYGGWGYQLTFEADDDEGSIQRVFEKGKIYRYSFSDIDIDIEDPFSEILDNE